jgi:hypothetical protein
VFSACPRAGSAFMSCAPLGSKPYAFPFDR